MAPRSTSRTARRHPHSHLHPLPLAVRDGLAAARLSRFVTTDWLGEWLFVARLKEAARRADARRWLEMGATDEEEAYRLAEDSHLTVAAKAVKGLDCPFCVGFWIGLAVLATRCLPGPLGRLRSLLLDALALNYVVGHVSSRLDAD